MSDFLKSNPQLDAAIINATTGPNAGYENMREAMLQALAAQGRVVRSRTDACDVRVVSQPPAAPTPRLDDEAHDSRPPNAERVLYLSGNSRIVITSADGESALDQIEAQLRASLGSPK
jgi:hypothetical protein